MNLIIDIGNTRIKSAIFDRQNQMLAFENFKNNQAIEKIDELIQKHSPGFAIISEVGKKIEGLDKLLTSNKIKFFYLNHRLQLPFTIDYKTPSSLGADRMALVAGAIFHQPEGNKLIIDAGTCITYDFIDGKNIYYGGAISPGIKLRFQSLNNYTDKLPLINQQNIDNIDLIGQSTKASIETGVIYGIINEIEGFIVKYNLKYKNLTIFLTGGSQKVLDRYIKNKIFVNSKFLLLEGMNFILNLNK